MHSRFDIRTPKNRFQQSLYYKQAAIFVLRIYPANAQFQYAKALVVLDLNCTSKDL